MIVGYVRPLYYDKKLENQLHILNDTCDKVYQETHGSPKKRTQLERLLMELQPGDSLVVERMSVLADTSRELMELLKVCEKDRVKIYFLNEKLDSESVLNISLQEMMAHILQFQTDILKQSTMIGMDQASKQGKSIGRPKKSDENINRAIAMYNQGYKLVEIKEETGISKSTLYRYLEAFEAE